LAASIAAGALGLAGSGAGSPPPNNRRMNPGRGFFSPSSLKPPSFFAVLSALSFP
jgi:hypothetical protein